MATIADVAALAGVSSMTVSRVLNQTGNVSPVKRDAVMQAVAALNYQPNLVARSLATSKTGTIGMIVTEMGNAVYPSYMEGASDRLRKAGLDVVVYYATSYQQTLSGLHTLLNKQVDGLIVLPLEIHENSEARMRFSKVFHNAVERAQKPLVMIGNTFLKKYPSVAEDYAAGAVMAVNYLVEKGHRDIGYIHSITVGYPWDERTHGFKQAVAVHHLSVGHDWSVRVPEDYDDAIVVVRRWITQLQEKKRALPSAVYCANDLIALATLHACQQEGFRVPEDISIIGHDGIFYTAYSNPRLSTVALMPHETGKTVAEVLLSTMDERPGKKGPEKRLMPPHLIPGATVREGPRSPVTGFYRENER